MNTVDNAFTAFKEFGRFFDLNSARGSFTSADTDLNYEVRANSLTHFFKDTNREFASVFNASAIFISTFVEIVGKELCE